MNVGVRGNFDRVGISMTGPRQNRHTGDVGEHRVALLLNELGFSVAKPSPDPGVDILAMSWQAEPKYQDITFYFQAKERRSSEATGVPVSYNLAAMVPTTPVLIIWTSRTAFLNKFRVCVLHRWLLKNRARVRSDKSLSIPRGAFECVADSRRMRSFLADEAARVSGREKTLWRATTHNPSAVAESEVLLGADNLCSREPTLAVIDKVQEVIQAGTSEGLFQALATIRGQHSGSSVDRVRGDPVIARWLEGIGNAPSHELKNTENRLVRDFTLSVESYLRGDYFSMPKYTWEEMNTWQILLGVYPATLDLVKEVLCHQDRWAVRKAKGIWSREEVKASLSLLSGAICSNDSVVSQNARQVIDQMVKQYGYPGSCQDENDYGFQHAFYFALAQIDDPHRKRAQDFFMQNEDRQDWELCLNRRYWNSPDDSALYRTAISRNKDPRLRDRNLIPLREIQLESVGKYGVVTEEEEPSDRLVAQ